MKIDNACKITAPVLFMITIMIVFPAPLESTSTSNEVKFYGFAEIIKYDENGNAVFTQTVHNQLVNTGEDFLLDQTFQDTVSVADDVQIGAICITNAGSPTIAETETAATFDAANSIGETNCIEDTSVTTSGGTAVIGPLTFDVPTHAGNGDTITAIGICQNDTTDNDPFATCALGGILFAVVNTSDVTLATSETVQITYTFDITSSGS